MKEIDKYGILKEKLNGICEENNLTYSIQNRKYPFLMTVKPLGGLDNQQTMMEGMENTDGTGYISPDATLVFAYRDGELSYKISETWTISATLFNKLKNLFVKLCNMWMMYFFRDVMETGGIPASDNSTAEPEPEICDAEGEDTSDAFDEFLADAEPAVDEQGDPDDMVFMDEAEALLYHDGGAGEDDEETEEDTPDDAGADE